MTDAPITDADPIETPFGTAAPDGALLPDAPAEPPRLPRPGEVIMAYGPSKEDPDRPGPFRSPALVLSVEPREDGPARLVVARSFGERKVVDPDGTERRAFDRLYGTDLVVDSFEGMAAAGLSAPRKFSLGFQATIPWSPDWVDAARDGGPTLGALTDADFLRACKAHGLARHLGRTGVAEGLPLPESALPRAGDVILAKPPFDEADMRPGQRPLPCLVLDVAPGEDGAPARLRVAPANPLYPTDTVFASDLAMTDRGELQEAGLDAPRKFPLKFHREMPWSDEYLVFPREGATPILGRLAPTAFERAIKAYGLLAANEKDRDRTPANYALMPMPPRVGDVVYAYHAFDGRPNEPGQIPHPCVVMDVRTAYGPDGLPRTNLLVAPGTSQKTWMLGEGDMTIKDNDYLSRDAKGTVTKFKFSQPTVVPWRQGWMCFRDGGPVLGKLTEHRLEKARRHAPRHFEPGAMGRRLDDGPALG